MTFTTADLQIVLASATTIAAIVAPVITALISSRADQKRRKQELYENTTLKQLSAFASAYADWKSNMGRHGCRQSLISAAYELALFQKAPAIREKLILLADTVADTSSDPACIDEMYRELISPLAQNQGMWRM